MNDRPVKVCFVMPKTYPLFNPEVEGVFGGAEVDLYYIATELAKDNEFKIDFVVGDYGQQKISLVEKVRLIKSFRLSENLFFSMVKLWQALNLSNADIYLTKTASPGVSLLSFFCALKKKKFIYRTAHIRECDGSYIRKHCILGPLFQRAMKKAYTVLVQNNSDVKLFKQTIGFTPVAVPNGHRVNTFDSRNKKNILWVGRSGKAKGARRFVELAKLFPNENFVMICQQATGDNNYEQLVNNAHAVPNLEFIRRVSFHEIDKYFAAAKVFVNTSDSEGFPNTFIQACKAAAPILSYAVNPDEFLTRHLCGMACGADFEKLSHGLSFLLSDERYIELGQNGRKYVEHNHDIKNIVETYKDLFRKTAGK